jgi:hypothetical protein
MAWVQTRKQRAGGCGCTARANAPRALGIFSGAGGYRATAKNRQLLARLRRGESIGFTATASLKAKGLIPRTSKKLRGKKVLGPKYR